MIQLYQSTADSSKMDLLAYREIRSGKDKAVHLRITADKDKYSFYFSVFFRRRLFLAAPCRGIDGRFLSTSTAGGFVGSVFGLYVTTLGHPPSGSRAQFDWFEYRGDDETLK